MSLSLRNCLSVLGLVALSLYPSLQARATHIYGIDFYYSHVSGNTYTINLAVYGDCSGASFPVLSSASPVVDIYDTDTLLSSVTLTLQNPVSGVEVSPVCPSQFPYTNCSVPSSSLPGVVRFIYTSSITLPSTSGLWRFQFNGVMGGSSAGRSNSMTNVMTSAAGSVIQLTDTLNNTITDNSSALYNTIPTPYFCINALANYNPAAVDPDGDDLSFDLIPAMDATTGMAVMYIGPYTPTSPLGVVPGSFYFNNSNGQLTFTPDIMQRADVVYNVRETVGGVLKGTSQREMTMVVLSACVNTPPIGAFSNASDGHITSGTQFNICSSSGIFTIMLNPVDAEGDSISMTCSGLPSGATFSVAGDGTTTPHGTFQWNSATAPPGVYTFYINYKDWHCPLVGTQTIAYTITIQASTLAIAAVSVTEPTCRTYANGEVTVAATGGSTPYSYSMDNINFTPANTFTTLYQGVYTFFVTDNNQCSAHTTLTLTGYPAICIDSTRFFPATCHGMRDASATIFVSGDYSPYTYLLDALQPTVMPNRFNELSAGSYRAVITDSMGCVKDTVINVPEPEALILTVHTTPNTCKGEENTGMASISATGGTIPYTYLWTTQATAQSISELDNGNYGVTLHDAKGCADSATAIVTYDNCCTPLIPDAFSPNGDGHNDAFGIQYKGDMTLIEMAIYRG